MLFRALRSSHRKFLGATPTPFFTDPCTYFVKQKQRTREKTTVFLSMTNLM